MIYQEEIRDTVEHVCQYLPKTVRPQCRAFVEEYGDMVITYLAQSLDPQQICTELKLCDGKIDMRTIKGRIYKILTHFSLLTHFCYTFSI